MTLLLALARQYELVLVISRESSDQDVVKAFRQVALKAHPDKGGRPGDASKLNSTREAWLQRRLRVKDLQDLNANRKVPSKSAYQERVRSIIHSKASQKVAANIAKGFRRVCKEVVDGRGIATKG